MSLENETFDFGEGPMKIEGLFGSEYAYYKLSLADCENDYVNHDEIECIDEYKFIDSTKSLSRIRHHNKVKAKNKLNRFDKLGFWWTLGYGREGYKVRNYRDKRSSYYKRYSNKRARKTHNLSNGGQYKKVFDFWNEIY